MDIVTLKSVKKYFSTGNQQIQAVDGVDLTIEKGRFTAIVGASGSGKTTLLNLIGGLCRPTEGTVIVDGIDLSALDEDQLTVFRRRKVGFVFQEYNLIPDLTVRENILFPLALDNSRPDMIFFERITGLLGLEKYLDSFPHMLSGGAQQCTAIARALINNPAVLLLDEPLGALDLQLRRQMQTELKRLQKQLGITFLYITHDQEEAVNMSDRIVVMREGAIEQAGTPSEIYDRPKTSFVAGFVGTANLIDGVIEKASAGTALVRIGQTKAEIAGSPLFAEGDKVRFLVRSENLLLFTEPRAGCLPALVAEYGYAGGMLRIVLETGNGARLIASRQGVGAEFAVGQTVWAGWPPKSAVPVDLPEIGEEKAL